MSEEVIEAIVTEIGNEQDEEEEDSFWDASDNDSLLTSEKADEPDETQTTNENSEVSNTSDMPQCLDKLEMIHERVARIMKRVGFLSDSLRQVQKELKTYSSQKDDDALKYTKSCGDIGSTQTEPLTKPELNMLVERIGDSVACQTIEHNPFED